MVLSFSSPPQAVLFDFDGVLGMTMEDNFRAWGKAFATAGITLNKKEYYQLEGLNTTRLAKTILKKNGCELNQAEALVQLKEANYLADNNFCLYPGVTKLVHILSRQTQLGLVTGASLKRLESTVPSAFLEYFSVVVTGDLVTNPKPAPDPYLTATGMLDIIPTECLVVENAPLGIRSAKAAGMTCIALCTTLTGDDLIQADQVVADISALTDFFHTNLNLTYIDKDL